MVSFLRRRSRRFKSRRDVASWHESRRAVRSHHSSPGYSGYRCRRRNERVAEVDVGDELGSHENFFLDFVTERRPCVLRGYASTGSLGAVSTAATAQKPDQAWCDLLHDACGPDVTVRVEERADSNVEGRAFGLGREKRVSVRDFVKHVRDHPTESMWYLSTQPLDENADGRPSLSSEPCSSILTGSANAPPMVPPLLRSLKPANVNVWMGAAECDGFDSNSSGLHHDFHDNLLVQICGTKRLRLWDPSATAQMRPKGAVVKVHGNGRIVYASHPNVLADGRDAASDAAAFISAKLDDAGSDDDEIDALLEQALDNETGHDDFVDDFDDEGDDDEGDDDDDVGGAAFGDAAFDDSGDSSDDGAGGSYADDDDDAWAGDVDFSDDEVETLVARQLKQRANDDDADLDDSADDDDDDDSDDDDDDAAAVGAGGARRGEASPDNFSTLSKRSGRYAALARTPCCRDVLLSPGDAIYIPAGWWHEVSSSGRIHAAWNYWRVAWGSWVPRSSAAALQRAPCRTPVNA
ncbi:cupin-like domain-containing protein [Pelagophyceae sp. CCMP2097]|nr:cupin-like domain-containing protein [Pelagophyceae sp. CCMP2097]